MSYRWICWLTLWGVMGCETGGLATLDTGADFSESLLVESQLRDDEGAAESTLIRSGIQCTSSTYPTCNGSCPPSYPTCIAVSNACYCHGSGGTDRSADVRPL